MLLSDLLQDQNPWWRDGAIRRVRGYPVRRDIQPQILSRILRVDDRRATLLLGPRQVGKTILLLQLADDLLDQGWPPANLTYFDFSDERITGEVSARDVIDAQPTGLDSGYPRVFLLDEIRGATKWDRWLKQAVDAKVGRIVATDSAAGLLRTGTVESGQGRWDEIFVEGLSFREFLRLQTLSGEEVEETFSRRPGAFEQYLALGGFPEYAQRTDLPEVRRRLRGDIADKAILRDLSGLGVDVQRVKDLFVYLLQDSGAEFNAEARARDLGADPRSVRDWTRLLSDTMLVSPLERFLKHPAVGLRSKPKMYASDPGLAVAFAISARQDPVVRAQAFEAAVFRHLREVARYREGRLSYFRHRDDLEIDFVLDAPGLPLTGIEAKSGTRLRPEQIHRFLKAGQELGAERLLLVHGGVLGPAANEVRAIAAPDFLLDPKGWLEGGRDE